MALFERVPLLLAAQWALPPSDMVTGMSMFGIPGVRLAWLFAAATAVVIGAVSFILARRDRQMRFWALGMVLSMDGWKRGDSSMPASKPGLAIITSEMIVVDGASEPYHCQSSILSTTPL